MVVVLLVPFSHTLPFSIPIKNAGKYATRMGAGAGPEAALAGDGGDGDDAADFFLRFFLPSPFPIHSRVYLVLIEQRPPPFR